MFSVDRRANAEVDVVPTAVPPPFGPRPIDGIARHLRTRALTWTVPLSARISALKPANDELPDRGSSAAAAVK